MSPVQEEVLLRTMAAGAHPQHFVNVFCPCGEFSYQWVKGGFNGEIV